MMAASVRASSAISMETSADVSGMDSSSAQLRSVKFGYFVVRTRSAFLPHGVIFTVSYWCFQHRDSFSFQNFIS